MVARTVSESARPSAVHTAPVSAQSARGASSTVTAPVPSGATVSMRRASFPFTTNTFAMRPPVTPKGGLQDPVRHPGLRPAAPVRRLAEPELHHERALSIVHAQHVHEAPP